MTDERVVAKIKFCTPETIPDPPPIPRDKIFDFNKDQYNTYDDASIVYYDPISFNKQSNNVYATQSYGETSVIKFDLGFYKDLHKAPYIYYVDDAAWRNIVVDIYNSRYEKILTYDFDVSAQIQLKIDRETSLKLTKGIYYMQVSLLTHSSKKIVDKRDMKGEWIQVVENLDKEEIIDSIVLIDAKDCILQII